MIKIEFLEDCKIDKIDIDKRQVWEVKRLKNESTSHIIRGRTTESYKDYRVAGGKQIEEKQQVYSSLSEARSQSGSTQEWRPIGLDFSMKIIGTHSNSTHIYQLEGEDGKIQSIFSIDSISDRY